MSAAVSNTGLPPVSLGMPVYNAQRYVATALDSLLNQTHEDFELIISDNASTDATESICRDYARRDSRIRYDRQPENRGAWWNFNRVFELSRCEYFKWAASDDVCAPGYLERCLELLEADSTVVCCHSRTQKIDADGKPLRNLPDPTTVSPRNASSHAAHRRFGDVLLSSGWSARSYGVQRSGALRQTSLIRPYYGYEKVLLAELALHGRFHDLPETLFFQRVHTGASSQLKSATQKHAFFSPTLKRRTLPRFRLLQGYLAAVQRAPINFVERLKCLGWIGRYLLQVQKWKVAALSRLARRESSAAYAETEML